MNRRDFIRKTTMASSAVILAGAPLVGVAAGKMKKGVEEVLPVEDLMREHGALSRILLIYDETVRRIKDKEEMPPALLHDSAKLVHAFIEGYHEKLEEQYIFPRLRKAHHFAKTVDILLAQHHAGRKVTENILALSTEGQLKTSSPALLSALTEFTRMYRPHKAREDTVIFPAFKKLLTSKEYDQLGDQFETREHELFGTQGFEGVVAKIATIESALGIHDLDRFTPGSKV